MKETRKINKMVNIKPDQRDVANEPMLLRFW